VKIVSKYVKIDLELDSPHLLISRKLISWSEKPNSFMLVKPNRIFKYFRSIFQNILKLQNQTQYDNNAWKNCIYQCPLSGINFYHFWINELGGHRQFSVSFQHNLEEWKNQINKYWLKITIFPLLIISITKFKSWPFARVLINSYYKRKGIEKGNMFLKKHFFVKGKE
jgi:hypothetical protein